MQTPPTLHSSRQSLVQANERLRTQYSRHRSTAAFWNAYQQIQSELAQEFPEIRAELCDRMAEFAQQLGAVEEAQLLETAAYEY